jgi:GNAT superfamily N-acetyltransferase
VASVSVETQPRSEDIRQIEALIYGFNVEATGISDGRDLALFQRAADGSLEAGVCGSTWGGVCHVRYLFVAQSLRRQGRGTMLMRAVEAEARSRGCRLILLETHDFQAPGFYIKLGFTVTGRISDYPHGHTYLSLVKHLS